MKGESLKKGGEHERNDKIEATVMAAALATLCLLVALAVSTSMTSVTSEPAPRATAAGQLPVNAGIAQPLDAETPPNMR